MKSTVLFLLTQLILLCSSYPTLGQTRQEKDSLYLLIQNDETPYKEKLKQIEEYLSEKHPDSLKKKVARVGKKISHKKDDSINFFKYSELTRDLSVKTKDTKLIAITYFYEGKFFSNRYRLENAYEKYFESQRLFGLIGDTIRMSRALNNMAIIEKNMGDYRRSEETTVKIIELLGDKVEKIRLSSFYNNLGIVNEELEEYDRAIDFHKKALELRKESPLLMAHSTNNLCYVYLEKEDYKAALMLIEDSNRENGYNAEIDSTTISKLKNTYGLTLMRIDYTNPKALSLFKNSLSISKKLKDIPMEMAVLKNITEYHYLNNNKEQAQKIMQEVYQTAKEYNNQQEIKEIVEFGLERDLFDHPESYIKESIAISKYLGQRRQKFMTHASTIRLELNKAINEKESLKKKNQQSIAKLILLFLLILLIISGLNYRRLIRVRNELLETRRLTKEIEQRELEQRKEVLQIAKELQQNEKKLTILKNKNEHSSQQVESLNEKINELNEMMYKFKEVELLPIGFKEELIKKIPALKNKEKLIEFWALQHKGYTYQEMGEYFLHVEESSVKDRAYRLHKILRKSFPHYKMINKKSSKIIYNRLLTEYNSKNPIPTF